MAKPIIEKMQKPCIVSIKHGGKKIFKKKFTMASDLFYYLKGTFEDEVVTSFARSIYKK